MANTNEQVIRTFVACRGKRNCYGHTMFSHDGTLYSCAMHVIQRIKPYHVETDGSPAKAAIPMATFSNGTSEHMLLSNWNGQNMTLTVHFKALFHHQKGIWVDDLRAKTSAAHLFNLRSMVNEAVEKMRKAARARLNANQNDRARAAERRVKDAMDYATEHLMRHNEALIGYAQHRISANHPEYSANILAETCDMLGPR